MVVTRYFAAIDQLAIFAFNEPPFFQFFNSDYSKLLFITVNSLKHWYNRTLVSEQISGVTEHWYNTTEHCYNRTRITEHWYNKREYTGITEQNTNITEQNTGITEHTLV